MLRKFNVRRWCALPSSLSWRSTKTSVVTVCEDWLKGWLQRLAGNLVCWDLPARGHQMGIICRGSLLLGSCLGEARD